MRHDRMYSERLPRRAGASVCGIFEGKHLIGLRRSIFGISYVRGRVGKRFLWRKGRLLKLIADFSYGIVPAVVPADVRLSIGDDPVPVSRTYGFSCLAAGLKGDKEVSANTVPHPPLAEEAASSHPGCARTSELDSRHIGHGEGLLMAILEHDDQRVLFVICERHCVSGDNQHNKNKKERDGRSHYQGSS